MNMCHVPTALSPNDSLGVDECEDVKETGARAV